ncbi:DppB ABC-type dipeptide/oligopeptide/nickel transport systems, permease components [Rhabdaerophilaceae bacterium]
MRVVVSRIGQALLTAWAIATLCFFFVQVLPGDVSLNIAVARVGEDRVTPEVAERIRREEGLDRPVIVQYAAWMGQLARLDLGRSLVTRKPVVDEISYHARFTLGLGLVGWLLSYVIALPLGLISGFRPHGLVDRITTGLSIALASLPTFLIGIGLISFFALTLRWLPPAGFRTPSHMVLPALTLALSLAAFSTTIIRNAVVEVRSAFYMTFARVKGLSAKSAFRHHGARNAAIPIVTFAALQFAFVVDGFVIIETLFNYPGLGELLVRSLIARDVPIIMGASLLIGMLYALINLAADVIALRLDPRRAAGLAQ